MAVRTHLNVIVNLAKAKEELLTRMWRNKIFFRFLLSYIMIMLIPIFLGFAAYKDTVRIMERNEQEASLSTLEQSINILDTRLAEIESIATQLSLNPKILRFTMESSPYINPKLPWKINEVQREIASLTFGNDFINMLCVYFGKSDVVISDSKSFISLSHFYDVFFKYGEMSKDEWRDNILSGKYFNKYFPTTHVRLGFMGKENKTAEEPMLIYMRSFPSSIENKCQVIMFIPISNISELFQNITVDQAGLACIMDPQGEILFSSSVLQQTIDLEQIYLQGINGSIIQNIDGQKMIVNCKTSSYNGWKYIAIVPYNMVMEKVRYIKQIINLIFALTMLMGLLGASFMAYRNCKPIRSIIETLQRLMEGSKPVDVEQNEYVYLRKSIIDLITDNKNMRENLKKHIPLMKTIFVEKLLSGNFLNDEEIQWFLDQLGLVRFDGDIVVAISQMDVESSYITEMSAIKLILKDTIERYLGSDVYFHDLDFDKQAIIFNICEANIAEKGNIDKGRYVQEVLDIVCKDMYNCHNVSVSFTVGSLVKDYMEISRSFDEAKEALDYKTLSKNKSVLMYSEIPKNQDSCYYPMNIENRIINYAKLGDSKQINEILKLLYKENFVKRDLSYDMVCQLMFQLKGTLLRILDVLSVEHQEISKHIVEELSNFDNYKSIDNMFELIFGIVDKICNLFKEDKKNKYSYLIDDIIKYIHLNYKNPQLSLTELADQFGLAPAYISQLFKEKTKKNFTTYLEQIRIEEACKLLLKGMPVNQVAQEVGYNSVYVFRRAFKRTQGMLPSEYKSSINIKESII